MKAGRTINEYTLTTDLRPAGGGQCVWGFARKDGEEYFIKQFLSPKYPTDDSPGSEATKAYKRNECDVFERHHVMLWKALEPVHGGNLIVTHDFFRDGPKYYKVTEKVTNSRLGPADIAVLDSGDKVLLLRSIVNSVRRLHTIAGVVHGDLKPRNILIFTTATGNYSAKLIDFDNAYKAGEPAANSEDEEVVGDVVYYSPELSRYVRGDPSVPPSALSFPADIFALGIVFAEYLTGSRPGFDARTAGSVAEAVLGGQTLVIGPTGMPPHVDALLRRMLLRDPAARPTATELMEQFVLDPPVVPDPDPTLISHSATVPGASPGRLRGAVGVGGLGTAPAPAGAPAPVAPAVTPPPAPSVAAPADASPSRLRGTMLKRRD